MYVSDIIIVYTFDDLICFISIFPRPSDSSSLNAARAPAPDL